MTVAGITEKAIMNIPRDLMETKKSVEKNIDTIISVLKTKKNAFLIGCGDSYFVGIYGAYLLEALTPIRAYAEESHEFLYKQKFSNDDCLIAISASGATAKTVDALRYAKKKVITTIALTNSQNSVLAREADFCIITRAQGKGAPTSTSVCAMYALTILAQDLAKETKIEIPELVLETIEKIPSLVGNVINMSRDFAKLVSEKIADHDVIYLTGAGPCYASALFGAAKLRELAYLHSIAFEAEEFCHYPFLSLTSNDIAIVVASNGKSSERIFKILNALETLRVNTILIADHKFISSVNIKPEITIELPEIPELIAPIINVIPLQLIAVETAKRRGIKDATFRYADILFDLIGYYI